MNVLQGFFVSDAILETGWGAELPPHCAQIPSCHRDLHRTSTVNLMVRESL